MATVDRAGRTTTLTYDAAGRLTRTQFADGAEVQTTYDLAGRVATHVDARGGVTIGQSILVDPFHRRGDPDCDR